MILDKSTDFHNLRQKANVEITYASVAPIREKINQLNISISNLQRKLNRNSLPSFSSREKRFREIDICKENINAMVHDIEQTIKDIDIIEPRMLSSIQTYFLGILKKIIIFYRSVQQENLKKHEVYNEYMSPETCYEDDRLLQMTISRASQIRQNIFNLTNTLLELKMALSKQTNLIDRIDFYFDQSNFYLGEANREIDKMPGSFTEYKNFIIYCLIYIICILFILTVIKVAKSKQ